MDKKRILGFLGSLVLASCGVFLLISLLAHSPAEGPFPDYPSNTRLVNTCGIVGAYLSSYCLALLGWASYGLAAIMIGSGGALLLHVEPKVVGVKAGAALLGLVAFMVGVGVLNAAPASSGSTYYPETGLGGGAGGVLLTSLLYGGVGPTGASLFCSLLGAFSLSLLAGEQLLKAVQSTKNWKPRLNIKRFLPDFSAWKEKLSKAGSVLTSSDSTSSASSESASESRPKPTPKPAQKAVQTARSSDSKSKSSESKKKETTSSRAQSDEKAEEKSKTGEKSETKRDLEVLSPTSKPQDVSSREGGEARDFEPGPDSEQKDFELPPVDILKEIDTETGESEAEIKRKGGVLEQTLSEFKIDAEVVRVQRGPVVTMYEVALAAGTKVSKVESLSDDLAIALKAPNVRIVAPIPGKSTIGIEVPNAERELVGLREVIEHTREKAKKCSIPMFIGKDTGGNPLIMDLATAPHLLIAGATGSGKSVALNSMICSMLMTRTPRQAQMLLLDPKGVELTDYKDMPHLMSPILTDMKKAATVLEWACKKMDERYSVLSQVSVRDLHSYNALGKEEILRRLDPEEDADVDDVPFYMPHIIIVIDELAELMLVAAKEVENSIVRLTQKARAVGIHLLCATQRPSADVITGLIKANLPARIAFQVSSKVDSRTILDRNGAELLLGKGDMLLLPPGTSRLVRAQGALTSDPEIKKLISFWADQAEPNFQREIKEFQADADDSDKDEYYEDAVEIVLNSQRGSVSLLQRRLQIGYSRAARLIDQMAEAGIVGPYRGSKAREVMLTMEEWEEARSNAS